MCVYIIIDSYGNILSVYKHEEDANSFKANSKESVTVEAHRVKL